MTSADATVHTILRTVSALDYMIVELDGLAAIALGCASSNLYATR